MVIGNGLIGSAFIKDYQDNELIVIFASGVSNSSETSPSAFLLEENLLLKTLSENKEKRIIYFSSFIDPHTSKLKYMKHKSSMEYIIEQSKNIHTIIKLPQIIGKGGNPKNLVNYIVNSIKNDDEILVYQNTYRALIDIDDLKKIVDMLIKDFSSESIKIEFPYIEKLLVEDIIKILESYLNKTAKIKMNESLGYDFPQCSEFAKMIINQLNIEINGYTERIIKKYV